MVKFHNFQIVSLLFLVTLNTQFVRAQDLFEEESMLSDFYGDELTVSIATGAVQPIYKAPAVASLITAEELIRTGARDIDSALERVPGLHVSRDHIANNPIYTFRGIYSGLNPQVLMLINGVPITNLFNGDRNQAWGGMPVEAISRIEVIRGPGSALYGADAFAGVINIVLKTGSEIDKAQAGIRMGSFDTQEYWYVNGGKGDELEWMFSLEYSETDGSDEVIKQDLQTQIDNGIAALLGPAFATNASLAPGEVNKAVDRLDLRLGLNWRDFKFNLGLQNREGQNYAGVAQSLDTENITSSTRWNADLNYDNDTWFEDWEISAQGSFFHTTQEIDNDLVLFPPGTTGPTPLPLNPFAFPDPVSNPLISYPFGIISNPEVYESHSRFKLSGRYKGFDKHDISVGVGYYYGDIYKTKEEKNYLFTILPGMGGPDQLLLAPLPLPPGQLADVTDTPLVFLPEGSRENYYFFAQDIWHFSNDWELTAGIRYDDYSDFGSTVNPRLALVWSTSANLTTKFLYGSAFRAPSFSETSVSSNPSFLGSADLDPETLDSYEIAFDYRPSAKVEMAVNFFYYKWQDIIQFVPEGVGISRAANVGEQSGYGSEFEITWRPSIQLEVRGNLALQKSEDKTSDSDSANAPEKQLYLQANWRPVENWEFSLQGNWVMDRNRAANDFRNDIDDYVLVDLTLRKTNVLDGLDAAIIVNNMFDKDAYEPSRAANDTGLAAIPGDLPLQGRTIVGELRYNF